MDDFDPHTADLKCLIILDEICKVNANNIQDILQMAEDNIKTVQNVLLKCCQTVGQITRETTFGCNS